jgi:hypothetical protein
MLQNVHQCNEKKEILKEDKRQGQDYEDKWRRRRNLIRNRNFNNAVFWEVTPCGPCKNRRFGGT